MLSSSFSSQSFFFKSFCLLFLQFPDKQMMKTQTIYVLLWCNFWSSWGTKGGLLPHKCCLENLNFCRQSTYRMFIIFTVCAANDVLSSLWPPTSFCFWMRACSISYSSWFINSCSGGTMGDVWTKLLSSKVAIFRTNVGIHAYWYIL